jgi:hypothetical protein
MRNGIESGPLPNIGLPFAAEIEKACALHDTFSPLVAYAVKVNETSNSTDAAEMQDGTVPGTDYLEDGSNAGHGIFQLTSSWPSDWADPYANAAYAIWHDDAVLQGLRACETYWANQGVTGEGLVRAIAASFNAGINGAQQGHDCGNVDLNTTNNYGARALSHYQALAAGRSPFS